MGFFVLPDGQWEKRIPLRNLLFAFGLIVACGNDAFRNWKWHEMPALFIPIGVRLAAPALDALGKCGVHFDVVGIVAEAFVGRLLQLQ